MYKQAVYRDGGLVLWRHEDAAGGWRFEIRLEMASRLCAEGDLTIAMRAACSARDLYLHRLSFRWVEGAFEQAFPHNAPSFFCFAALQGIAQALGIGEAVAVKPAWQSAYTPAEARHFANAYDSFWETLGGIPMNGPLWRIALPIHLKPLSEVPSRHRRRAALRREHWQAIGGATRLSLQRHRQNRCSES